MANIIYFIVIPAFALFVLYIVIMTKEDLNELNKLSQNKRVEIAPFIRENAIRQLTEEEILFLQPYLDNKDPMPSPYQWKSPLISSDVTRIKGYIEKIYTDRYSLECYYKMEDIHLLFPYNMDGDIIGFHKDYEDYEDYEDCEDNLLNIKSKCINTAEVVFTRSYAIVVKINTCELLEVCLNLSDRKVSQIIDYWQTGDLKPIDLSSVEKANETITQLVTEESEKALPFEIVNKREKNQYETAMEDQSNSGKLMVFLFVLGVMGLLVLEHFQSLWLAVFSILCFILAMIISHIKREIPTEYVNHIKAQWDTEFDVPDHWRMFISNKSDTPIDIEVEVNSLKLLSYGDYLSISEEVENYGAPKFIKHNVILAITGLILTVLIYYFTDAGEKFDFSYQQLTSQATTWNIDDKTNFKKIAFQFMDRVNLDLSSVSCDIKNKDHSQCNKIFVNINPIDSTKLNLFSSWPQSTRAIYDSNILKMIEDQEVIVKTALANKHLNQRLENDFKKYGNNPKNKQYTKNKNIVELIKIYNIETAILTFDDSCKHLNLEPCDQIKKSLANLLSELSGVDLNNWSDVVAYAESHCNIKKIVNLTSAQNIVQLVAEYRTNILKHFIFDAKEKVAMLQNDENNLSLQFTKLIPLYDKNYKHNYNNEIFKKQLDYYNGILMGNNANLKITGVVTNVSYHNGAVSKLTISTDPIYNIDKNDLFSFSSLILINNIVFLFVILVTLINCILFIWKKVTNQLRLEKIIANYSDKILKDQSEVEE